MKGHEEENLKKYPCQVVYRGIFSGVMKIKSIVGKGTVVGKHQAGGLICHGVSRYQVQTKGTAPKGCAE